MDVRSDHLAAADQTGEDPTAAPQSIAPTSETRLERPGASNGEQRPFQDMPPWIWRLFFAAWAALFGTFVVTFGVSGEVRFVLGVVAAFAAVFFVTPLVLLRMTRRAKPTKVRSYLGQIHTLNGPCSELEAAVQIALLPITLTLGLIVIAMFVPR